MHDPSAETAVCPWDPKHVVKASRLKRHTYRCNKRPVDAATREAERAPQPFVPNPDLDLVTLYADDQIAVLIKPSGLLSVPGNGPEKQGART